MTLDKAQKTSVLKVWRYYVEGGERFENASREFTQEELDLRRRETIPEIVSWIKRFREGEVSLEEFKTSVDGINKRNRLWGFKGINGQMFFNVLVKTSNAGSRLADLTDLLKQSIALPVSAEEAKARIGEFRGYTGALGEFSQDPRGAPKVGSIPYFLSYFWQIQAPDVFPVYYTSMVQVLNDLGIWAPTGDVGEDYSAFMELNSELREILSQDAGRPLHLWDVEHAFWFFQQESQKEEPGIKVEAAPSVQALLDSYIPPVVAVLRHLAANDQSLEEQCRRAGTTVEKVFEERVAILFRMLGYDVEALGQGYGRAPDGVAKSREYHYAIVYDAKVRREGYTMGTDDRAAKEYISSTGERLRKEGIKNMYFAVISSSFTGDHDDVIRDLKIETDVKEVLFVEASALLVLLEGKFRNPELTLGPDGLQRLLTSSGILSEADAREFVGV